MPGLVGRTSIIQVVNPKHFVLTACMLSLYVLALVLYNNVNILRRFLALVTARVVSAITIDGASAPPA